MNTYEDFMPPQRARVQGLGYAEPPHGDQVPHHPVEEVSPLAAPTGERPITVPDQDRLGRNDMAKRLAAEITSPEWQSVRGMTVGITGNWGTGKTSMLNLLEFELSERRPRPIVVRFDPWLVTGRDSLVTDFFSTFAAVLSQERRFKEQTDRASDLVMSYGTLLGGARSAVVRAIRPEAESARGGAGLSGTLSGQKDALAHALRKVDLPIVVLIDDVDSLEDSDRRGLIQLIRGLADFEKLCFVLAYDEALLVDSLAGDVPEGQGSSRGRAQLEKLVQLQVPLPQVSWTDLKTLLLRELTLIAGGDEAQAENAFESDPRFQDLARILFQGQILRTPRDVKRVTGQVRALASVSRGAVDLTDIAGYCALMAKAPEVGSDIGFCPERYCVDGDEAHQGGLSLSALGARPKPENSAVAVLVDFLFPADMAKVDRRALSKNRLCLLENLQSVLKFGTGVGASHSAVAAKPEPKPASRQTPRPTPPAPNPYEELLKADSDVIASEMIEAMADNSVADLLTGIRSVYPKSKSARDDMIWVGMLYALKRLQSDPGEFACDPRRTVGQIAALFTERAAASEAFPASGILSMFVTEREWNVCAQLLHSVWASAERGAQSSGWPLQDFYLETEEARNLTFQYVMQARTAQDQGAFLTQLFSIAPIMLLIEMGGWDAGWQTGLQDALINDSAETSARLLGLIFSPDIRIDTTMRIRIVGNAHITDHLAQLWTKTQAQGR